MCNVVAVYQDCTFSYTIEFIHLAGCHGDTQTNESLYRDGWDLSKLLSRGVRNRLLDNTDKL